MQFDLFGDALPAPPAAKRGGGRGRGAETPILPAIVPSAQIALAQTLSKNLYLGTSTWSFPGWAGLVYAETAPKVHSGEKSAISASQLSREGLRAYAQHPLLRTVGIDRTFYAPISREAFAEFASQVPPDFSFLCKAPNSITSPFVQGEAGYTTQRNATFLDVDLAMRSFIEPAIAGLGEKAGPLVFQFSPLGREATQTPDEMTGRLLTFLANVRAAAGASPRLAIEVRNRELLTPAFEDGLARVGVHYCVGVHPRMPSAAVQLDAMAAAVARGLVVRWSLNPHTGQDYTGAKEQYAPFNTLVDEDIGTRATLARAAATALARGEKVHMVANNKAEGSSPLTMFKLAEAIAALNLEDPIL